ncbi:uncharacterized protein LOC110913553 [Helianthus annuus]|uniref:uncharacterized protein LOC110913553 n=1 Tax=Helianthus annuus TaxID=4232 RepID=UPI000B8F6720|nr:uncharacterized protein LOC110913553 [Helianthus annuus]
MNSNWEEPSVATVKEQIYKHMESEREEEWKHWNSWMPAKINYFIWRVGIERIPVKTELRKRGIGLDDYLCPRCRSEEKTVNHVISECVESVIVWRQIIDWLKLPSVADTSSCEKALTYADGLKGSILWRKTVKMEMQATMWHLWKARNGKEFKGIARTGESIVEEIKADTFLWLKSRSKVKDIVWERWEDFNIRDIIK